MKRSFILAAALIACSLAAGSSTGRAATLFSGGDINGGYGYSVEYTTNVGAPNGNYFRQYQQLTVPAGNLWTVTGVFSSFVIGDVPTNELTQGRFELRQNVTAGNGGTLLSSGNVPVTGTNSGTNTSNGPIARFDSLSFTPLTLSPGTYWMEFTLYTSGVKNLFQAYSAGTNAVNLPPGGGNNYLDSLINGSRSQFTAYNNTSAEGLTGTAVVPEPATAVLLLTVGGAGLAAAAARRRGKR